MNRSAVDSRGDAVGNRFEPIRTWQARLMLVNCDAFEICPTGLCRYLFRLAILPGVVIARARIMSVPGFAKSHFEYGSVISRRPERALPWVKALAATLAIRRDLAHLVLESSNDQTLSAAQQFANYHHPVQVVWVEHHRPFRPLLGRWLARAFTRRRFEVVAGSATNAPVDQPHRLAVLVGDLGTGVLQ